ncbi:MAG: S8 family serine peptidase, partial [Actinomycetia bacterium]|nr:S8 family serine peptidase [Actinomycetes bacterium]
PMSIGVPGNNPYVITPGAMSDALTPADPSDDYLATWSSAGPTLEAFVKPDLVAPGGHTLGLMPASATIAQAHPEFQLDGNYFTMSGTSQAAGVTSGVVALMLQDDPTLTPDEVKCKLMDSAHAAVDGNDLAYSPFQQGAGLIDAQRAVDSTATGCANQGLNIANDVNDTEHYMGPVRFDGTNEDFY